MDDYRKINSKIPSEEYKENWDKIFSKKEEKPILICAYCGCEDIWYEAYQSVNNPDIVMTFKQDVFCDGCGGPTSLVEKKT